MSCRISIFSCSCYCSYPAGVWRQELILTPPVGPCAGIFRRINPLIPLVLIKHGIVYLSVSSCQRDGVLRHRRYHQEWSGNTMLGCDNTNKNQSALVRDSETEHIIIQASTYPAHAQRLLVAAFITLLCEQNNIMDDYRHINTNGSGSRAAFHRNQTLCTQLLKTYTAAVPLQILPSKVTGAGAGLSTTKDVDYGEEIFRSDQVISCVEDGMQNIVCDNCYAYQESKIHSSGRFRAAEDPKLEMKACNGCKVCYY